jgi:hypothetical protein
MTYYITNVLYVKNKQPIFAEKCFISIFCGLIRKQKSVFSLTFDFSTLTTLEQSSATLLQNVAALHLSLMPCPLTPVPLPSGIFGGSQLMACG